VSTVEHQDDLPPPSYSNLCLLQDSKHSQFMATKTRWEQCGAVNGILGPTSGPNLPP